jgi:hypothetical protein
MPTYSLTKPKEKVLPPTLSGADEGGVDYMKIIEKNATGIVSGIVAKYNPEIYFAASEITVKSPVPFSNKTIDELNSICTVTEV